METQDLILTEVEKKIIEVANNLETRQIITTQLADEVYFGIPDMLGSSSLKELRKTPAHYKNPKPYEADNYNKCIHLAILEPEKFKEVMVLQDFRTNDNKKAREDAELDGKVVMTLKKYNEVLPVCKAHTENPNIKKYVDNCETEINYLCYDKTYNKVKMRMKADIINHDKQIILDLKNMGSPEEGLTNDEIYRRAKKKGWFFQASLYLRILKIVFNKDYKFSFLFIEDKPPFGMREIEFQSALKDYYDLLLEKELIKLQNCYETNKFPCYPPEPDYFDVPEYDMQRINKTENQEVV